MVNLILDTNIWITFVAKNNPPRLLEKLYQRAEEEEIILLSNEIILKEWFRNKAQTIKDVTKEISESFDSVDKLASYLPKDEMNYLRSQLNPLFNKKDQIIQIAVDRVEKTEELIKKCRMTPITDEMKIIVSDWGIERQAPFKKKGSVADALILLSSVEYCKKHTSGITDSIFVSFNHTDYTDGQDIDEIHNELRELLSGANMIFKRNISDVLKLTPEMTEKIGKYITNYLKDMMGMNHFDFFEYHNRHIRYRLHNGMEGTVIIIDPMTYDEAGHYSNFYDLIPTKNMMEYRQADLNGDERRMKELSLKIDITKVVWAQRLE